MSHVGGTVGFTGTQNGLTGAQLAALENLLMELEPDEARHGDCIGADAEFHSLLLAFRREGIQVKIHLHPGTDTHGESPKRAFCREAETIDHPRPYLKRNEEIVKLSDVLIACPGSSREGKRSGTWATIRRARWAQKTHYIIFPDGEIGYHNKEA